MYKKVNLLFFSILFLVLTLSNVMAQPPQTQVSTVGYEVAYPSYEYVKQNTAFNLNFHVFNSSSLITNKTTTCYLELYGSTGQHTLKQEAVFEPPFEYEVQINEKNFTDLGIYSYIIKCNSSLESGFANGAFEVTPTGFGSLKTYYYLIFILVFSIIALGFWIEDGWIIILGGFGLLFIGFLIITYGIDTMKNTTYTFPLGLLTWGLALYLFIRGSIDQLGGK